MEIAELFLGGIMAGIGAWVWWNIIRPLNSDSTNVFETIVNQWDGVLFVILAIACPTCIIGGFIELFKILF